MRTDSLFRSTVFRLTAVYLIGFAATLALLGAATYMIVDHRLERRLDDRIRMEVVSLQESFRSGGVGALVTTVNAHQQSHPNGALDYAVVQGGRRLAGRLMKWPSAPGWSSHPYREEAGETGRRRFLVTNLGQNVKLAVAADPEQVEEITRAIFGGFMSAFGAVLALGVIGAIALSHALMKRVGVIRRTSEAIVKGDLSRRIPLQNNGDDFDLLSQTLNHMLDRIGELMESLRQVSVNIAHDLKTPLAHLRNRLEQMTELPPQDQAAAVEEAVARVDDILATFGALLRIAQVEAGTRRAGFASVDLSQLCQSIIETFAPAAEDEGRSLEAIIDPGIRVHGDRELLTQSLANLVENGIRHTPRGTRIQLALTQVTDWIMICVTDDGPGISTAEREHIFRRFYRGANVEKGSGSGLGLSLVKAVAELHGGRVTARDASPGLTIQIDMPTTGVLAMGFT